MANYKDELYHFGVMGMRWGHRSSRSIEKQKKKALKKEVKADMKWEKKAHSSDTFVEVNNKASVRINSKLDAFNKKWEGIDFTDAKNEKDYEKYVKSYGKLWDKILNQVASEVIPPSPSGKYRIKVTTSEPGAFPTINTIEIDKK